MRGDKPPRQKRGNQRRLAEISAFADMGVEPSPLFEWTLLVTLCGHKVTETTARKPWNSFLNIEFLVLLFRDKSTEE